MPRKLAVWTIGLWLLAGCSGFVGTGATGTPSTTRPASGSTTAAGESVAETRPETATSSSITTTTAPLRIQRLQAMGLSAGPGTAWLGSRDCGLVVITPDGAWYAFPDEDLPIGRITDIAAAPDGMMFFATDGGLLRLEGTAWSEIAGPSPSAIAIAPDGSVWGVDYRNTIHYEGSTWTEHPYSEFSHEDTASAGDVAVDPQGAVWVMTGDEVARYDGITWEVWGSGAGLPDSDYPFALSSIATGPEGEVWVAHREGILYFDGAEWSEADVPERLHQPRNLTATPGGKVLVPTYARGLGVFDGSWSLLGPDSGGLHTQWTRAAFEDERGRLWIGTTWGLAVLDGGEATVYTRATSALAGDCVEHIVVTGEGPELIPPGDLRVGSLTGRLLDGGAPVVDHRVVLCSDSPAMMYSGEHPCEGYVFAEMAVTDGAGVYRFDDVPVASYEMAWQVDDTTWMRFVVGGFDIVVREGETTDLPDLDLEEQDD